MKPKYKYTVNIHVITFDANAQPKSEPFQYVFNTGDLPTMRRQAIEKANEMISFFENEMPAGSEFSSSLAGELKGLKNIQCYSLAIYFYIDAEDYIISGDDELQQEMLEVEAFEYKRNGVVII